ncbi:hypothetical protein [Streptomyces sp. NPDC023588]|uniref:PKD domain-containing protein n=1 Tax=Streptomyces sp. NPDC023588 TaxID=3154907 RepID=UPI0033F6EE90
MRSRRLVISVAVIAATVGFIPGLAQADPITSKVPGVTAPDVNRIKDAAHFPTFKSPAERSVRRALPGSKGVAAGNGGAVAQQATGNPDLAIVLNAASTTAHALDLQTQVLSADASLIVTIAWGDGTTDKAAATGPTVLSNSHTYAELGEYTIKVTVTDAVNQAEVVNEFTVMTAGSDFTPYAPTRLLDTRDGTGAVQGKVAPYGSTRVKVGGNGGIPAGVTAVTLNVTVTNTTSGGHITAFAEDTERPASSNVNFEAGQTVPNLVIVPVGKNGYVELANRGAQSVDLIADVTGYFTRTASSGYTPMTPARFVDTREGLGTAQAKVKGRGVIATSISGLNGVPHGIKAVALNVTVTNPEQAGHLAVFPGGGPIPTASNLNFTVGQTIANSVIVPVAPDGSINIFNGAWSPTDVVVDVVGYYSTDSKAAFMPMGPFRMVDSREKNDWISGPLKARSYLPLPFYDGWGVEGCVLNATVTNTKGVGFLSVAPDSNAWVDYLNGTAKTPERPVSSALNWTAGKTVPNLVQASSGKHNVIDFWNQGWSDIDLVVDLFGFYQST